MLRPISGYELKRESKSKDSVFVKCFPGATIEDMHSYSWPSMKKNPSRIALHCGTNDLQSSDSADDIAKQLMTIACNLILSLNLMKSLCPGLFHDAMSGTRRR